MTTPTNTTPAACVDGVNTPPISDRDRVLALIAAERHIMRELWKAQLARGDYDGRRDSAIRADQCDVLYVKIDALLMLF